eukprot:UN12375
MMLYKIMTYTILIVFKFSKQICSDVNVSFLEN